MSLGAEETRQEADATGSRTLHPALRRAPGWLASVCLHGTVLFALAWVLRSHGGGSGNSPEVGTGQTNLYVVQPEVAGPLRIEETPQPGLPESPPVVLPPPEPDATREPLSPPTTQPLERAAQRNALLHNPRGGSGGGRGLGGSGGETSFFGIRDRGLRFVYVVDNSGSMSAFNAITYAKAELMASLDALEESQQFQVVFYNEAPRFMTGEGDGRMLAATTANRSLARTFVAEVQVAGGTDHMPALRAALALEPDVLYFLTDAGVPIIRAGDLEEIRQLNRTATRIHCIEFGRGPELLLESSLRKLARQNGGVYRYRDISTLNAE